MSKGQRRGNYIEAEEVSLSASIKKEVSIAYSIFFFTVDRGLNFFPEQFFQICVDQPDANTLALRQDRKPLAFIGKKEGLFMNVLHD